MTTTTAEAPPKAQETTPTTTTKSEVVRRQSEERTRLIVHDRTALAGWLDTAKFDHAWRCAKILAATDLVPEHFRRKPENCFIAFQMATQLEMDPYAALQQLYVVHGKPGMQAQMAIALVNKRGPFAGPLQFKMVGQPGTDDYGAKAYATHAVTGEVCEMTVTMRHAQSEGWIDKKGSKWLSIPDLMLRYRAASWFARLYCPEVLMGLQTAEELEDLQRANIVDTLEANAGGGRMDLPTAKANAAPGSSTRPTAATEPPKSPYTASGAPTMSHAPQAGKAATGDSPGDSGGIWWDGLVTLMVNAQGCDAVKAGDRLQSFAQRMYGKPLDELTERDRKDIAGHVRKGNVVVN